eukprot:5478294-Pyramimonas_sp.AAC.1
MIKKAFAVIFGDERMPDGLHAGVTLGKSDLWCPMFEVSSGDVKSQRAGQCWGYPCRTAPRVTPAKGHSSSAIARTSLPRACPISCVFLFRGMIQDASRLSSPGEKLHTSDRCQTTLIGSGERGG